MANGKFVLEFEMGDEGVVYCNTPMSITHEGHELGYEKLDTDEPFHELYEAMSFITDYIGHMTFEEMEELFYRKDSDDGIGRNDGEPNEGRQEEIDRANGAAR